MGVAASILELALAAESVGQSISLGQFQDQIKAVYAANQAEINTLVSLQNTINLMGLGDDKGIKIDIANSYVTDSFVSLYQNSQTQMNNLDQTIKSLSKTFYSSLKAVPSNSLDLGLSISGLAIVILIITKKHFPQVWQKTVGQVNGKIGSAVKNFYLKVKDSLKRCPEIVENKDGTLSVDQNPPIDPTEQVNESDSIKAKKWWNNMKQCFTSLAEICGVGFMIYQVVQQGIQIQQLRDQLIKKQQYFGKGGKFDQDLASLDKNMKDIVLFYGNIGPVLKQCVERMNSAFILKAFMNHPGRSANVATAMQYNYKKLGITSGLMEKSVKLTNDYNYIIKNNTGLKDRINRYGPIFNTFLEKYSAPQFEGTVDGNGMVKPTDCFNFVVSTLANTVSDNAGNLNNEATNIQNLLMIANACRDYILLRPPNFEQLTLPQKQAQDSYIWGLCSDYYTMVLLSGVGPLWNSDIQILTGIIMSLVDKFYYDDPTGETINNFNIQVTKAKNMYKDLINDQKNEGALFSIPFTPMPGQKTAEQMLVEALQYILTTVPPDTEPIYQSYNNLVQAQSNDALNPQSCTILLSYMKLHSSTTKCKDKQGNEVTVVTTDMLQTINFRVHINTYEYSVDSLTSKQYFEELG